MKSTFPLRVREKSNHIGLKTMPQVDQLIRSRRKTIGIYISQTDGVVKVVVRAPRRAHIKEINAFVANKQEWIDKTRAKILAQIDQNPVHKYMSGEVFPYLGAKFELRVVDVQSPSLVFDDQFYLDKTAQKNGQGRELFEKWYKEQARPYLLQRLTQLAEEFGFKFNRFRLSGATKRWGSCSSRGNINLSWRLIMLDPEIIDYVIIHELAHLKHQNHGKYFWQEVERMLPAYKSLRNRLKSSAYMTRL